MKRQLLTLVATLALTAPSQGVERRDNFVVHEWGTFTSLQDEQGRAIGGINTDDEPVPDFVHRLSTQLLLGETDVPQSLIKGAPRCHPDVTMRLETPVIYFYPPTLHMAKMPPVNVHVEFRGGWLTEFYPGADAVAPGLDRERPKGKFLDKHRGKHDAIQNYGSLTRETTGSLTWKKLEVGSGGELPETTDPVWLAPRQVKSENVQNKRGETEKYLFYRGLGNVNAPLSIARDREDGSLTVDTYDKPMPPAWLVEISADGTCAFSNQAGISKQHSHSKPLVRSKFTPENFSADKLPKLRAEMHQALVADGLYPDEAEAMLNTWQHAYFQTPGLRLMYICDREYTDRVLPLTISGPCELDRVMVGRIELVTPRQRELLRMIAAGPAPELTAVREKLYSSNSAFLQDAENLKLWTEILQGRKPVEALGVELPELYVAYLELGRFRNALILDEQRRNPAAELDKFIQIHDLVGFSPAVQQP